MAMFRLLRRWISLIVVAVMTGGMCGWAWLAASHLVVPNAAEAWYQRFAAIPDERLLGEMRDLTRDDGLGTERLLMALESDRPSAIYSARTLLIEKIDAWQRDESVPSASRMSHLAHQLAERVEQMPAAGQDAAAQVATRLLLLRVPITAEDNNTLISECEWILRIRAVADYNGTQDGPRVRERRGPAVEARARPRYSERGIPLPADDLPGGRLPVEVSRMPAQVNGAGPAAQRVPR